MALVIKFFTAQMLDIWHDKVSKKSGNNVEIPSGRRNQTKFTLRKTIIKILPVTDTRIDYLPLTSPLSVILILGSYAYFIGKLGPSLMKKREPFSINNVIIIYNIIQIVLNVWLFLYGLYNLYWYRPAFSFACQPLDFSLSNEAMKEAMGTYYFYILKLLDLVDTVFFILRKKSSHVSFLHVYHHVAVVFCTYLILLWAPGGHFLIVGFFNCLVHSVMYSYYLASVFKPELKHNLEVKKIVTKIQIFSVKITTDKVFKLRSRKLPWTSTRGENVVAIQFGFMLYFYGRPLLIQNCKLPKFFLFMILLQNAFLMSLFSNFYYKNYYKKN